MASLFKRKGRGFCVQFFDLNGKLVQRAAGKDRATALKRLREVEQGLQEAEESARGLSAPGALLKDLVGPWLEERKARGLRNGRTEAAYFTHQIIPRLGDKAVAEITREDVRRAVWDMQSKGLAPRSVRHAYGVLRVHFCDLVASGVVRASPCTLMRRELPKLLDKDPSWRTGAIFTREEVEILISSEAIPEDRKTLYALLFLTAARVGEAAGLRWRDLDERVEPLHRLTISRSYDGPTKTNRAREVPVHPTLAAILAEWRLGGFARLMGRPPRPDDLIVPSRRTIMRTRPHVYHRWQEDLDRLGFRRRRVHDARRTFITLARVDGASKDVLENITHRGLGGILDVYTTLPWKTLCDAVSCLKIQRLGAEVVRLRLVANAKEREVALGGEGDGGSGGDGVAPIDLLEWKTKFVKRSWERQTASRRRPAMRRGNQEQASVQNATSDSYCDHDREPVGSRTGLPGSASDRATELRGPVRRALEAVGLGDECRAERFIDQLLAELTRAQAREG